MFVQPLLPQPAREGLNRLWRSCRSQWTEQRRFLRAWMRSPRAVGAMAPSGKALAQAITRHTDASTGTVLELGCGTGAFTRALLERGVAETRLVLVERDPSFAHDLQQRFPQATVLQADAASASLRGALVAMGCRPGAIVCGLPLLNMTPRQQIRVMHGVFSVLQPQGALYLFTYGPRSPLCEAVARRLGLEAVRMERVLGNLPPAQVWRVTRRQAG
jgi:phosphatidylethanolamine/phosphatidyl-N-methylethanolamine N-methyltransferase